MKPGLVPLGKALKQDKTIESSTIKAGLGGNTPTSGHCEEGCLWSNSLVSLK